MKWHWTVRIYNDFGQYAITSIATNRDLKEIDAIQDAYLKMTGCKMLLVGMSESPNPGLLRVDGFGFSAIWKGIK